MSTILTAAECLLGYWLTTMDYPVTGGVIIGLAIGCALSREVNAR